MSYSLTIAHLPPSNISEKVQHNLHGLSCEHADYEQWKSVCAETYASAFLGHTSGRARQMPEVP